MGKQKKPILFKVTEPSSIPYITPPACAVTVEPQRSGSRNLTISSQQLLNKHSNLNVASTTHQGGANKETVRHCDTRLRPGTSGARSQPKSLEEQEEDVGILREEPHRHVPPYGPVTGTGTIEGIVTIEVR